MTLWEYLKIHLIKYKNQIAFANSGITYADILAFENIPQNGRMVALCEDESREIQALSILKNIAQQNVVVPLTKEYGQRNYEKIHSIVSNIDINSMGEVIFVMYTSGTTSMPKGVMLTHENIISNLECIESYFRLEDVNSICIGRPLVHIAVLVGELLYALCKGKLIYFYEEKFMPQRLLSFFLRNQIDVFCGTPTLYRALAIVDRNNSCPLKIGVISGEKLTTETHAKIIKAFPHVNFYNVYGLTEHSPRVSALLPMDFIAKPGSVGKPLKNVGLQIKDGEIILNSPCVMKGYYMDKEQTEKKIQNGWLHTGDKAHFDSDGFLYIDGRKDGMLIKAGINIYPEEIEAQIKNITGIEDCLIYGENIEGDEKICLKYIGDISIHELRRQLVKMINPNIIPEKIERVKEIKRTISGKKFRGK